MRALGLFALVSVMISMSSVERTYAATEAAAQSYGAVVVEDSSGPSGDYLLGDWQMHPLVGFTAINAEAGFNAGSSFAYKIFDGYGLHFEPGFTVTAFPGYAVFNFMAAARYDVTLPDTLLRPFAKFGFGPSFQTSGSTTVLNAFAGLGAIYPVNNRMDFRGEAGLVNLNGNAGFQMLAGVAF